MVILDNVDPVEGVVLLKSHIVHAQRQFHPVEAVVVMVTASFWSRIRLTNRCVEITELYE